MANIRMNAGWERTVRTAIRPTMSKIGTEIKDEWTAQIDVESGEMRAGTFAEVDAESSVAVGTVTSDGHGYWEEMGNSNRPGDPKLLPTASRPRGDYHA